MLNITSLTRNDTVSDKVTSEAFSPAAVPAEVAVGTVVSRSGYKFVVDAIDRTDRNVTLTGRNVYNRFID